MRKGGPSACTLPHMAQTEAKSGKAARRAEILRAAEREFMREGFAGASMAAIARRCRASKETLYAWFESKEQLFREVFRARLGSLTTGARRAMAEDPHPAHVLPVIVRDTVHMLLAVEPLIRAAASAGGGAVELAQDLGAVVREDRQRFVAYFEWCRAQGLIAFEDDPFEIASLFVAMASGEWSMSTTYRLVDQVTEEMIEAHAQRVTRLFLRALAP